MFAAGECCKDVMETRLENNVALLFEDIKYAVYG